jgi:hypothetical protein
MSETYCWQSRIASGSQAARCCGVHCCAAVGQDANASPRSAAAAMIGQNFGWAVRMSITHPPSDFRPGIYGQFNNQGKQRRRYEATREAAMADTLCVVRFNKRTPSRASSCRIEWLTAGAVSSSRWADFRHFAAKPHHPNRKAEYQGQHDDPRARLPITKQSRQKC